MARSVKIQSDNRGLGRSTETRAMIRQQLNARGGGGGFEIGVRGGRHVRVLTKICMMEGGGVREAREK